MSYPTTSEIHTVAICSVPGVCGCAFLVSFMHQGLKVKVVGKLRETSRGKSGRERRTTVDRTGGGQDANTSVSPGQD